ncbi:LacI family DNA-binding transcriptional regulator [Microbacterium marmarense]|uniref:LacI family DNA-binding transcriptional regulator n=1 Tax=Microbacterium marmarense TaxID=3122051 RepID=A0ABU8LRS5_9MICO
MADVAQHAGVSGQTVSRVVNNSPRVDPATRARVERAMATLGYRPHRAARALRTGRTHTIGLVVSTLATVGNSRMLQAVADAAASRGFALTVVTLGGSDDVSAAFERLVEQGVDGAIVLNEATAAARGARIPPGLHLVVVDSLPDDRFVGVQTDHAGGARAAVEHLLQLGHEEVWHVAGPRGSFAAEQRESAWRDVLVSAGATVPNVLRGDWSAASGAAAGVELAKAGATAVFCANDQMALGVLRALAEAGREVPDDVAVVGFDDVADAAQYRPPLTTVRQNFDVLGERAVAMLVHSIDGTGHTREEHDREEHDRDEHDRAGRVATTLVVRQSTRVGR